MTIFFYSYQIIKNLISTNQPTNYYKQLTMANKLNKEYPSITATKAILKENDEISVNQIKDYDRKARRSPFIMEHVKIIERLTQENEELKDVKIYWTFGDGAMILDSSHQENRDLREENEKLKEENAQMKKDIGLVMEVFISMGIAREVDDQ